jgi:uncharacterized paraquat-inducible protein A
MRINLGAAFAHLFKGENKATVTIKASENKLELFHKEDEKSLFPICKKSAKYADGWRYCTRCHTFFTINYTICPKDGIKLRNSPRKKKKGNNTILILFSLKPADHGKTSLGIF